MLDGGNSAFDMPPYDFKPSLPDPGVTCGQRYVPVVIDRSRADFTPSAMASGSPFAFAVRFADED